MGEVVVGNEEMLWVVGTISGGKNNGEREKHVLREYDRASWAATRCCGWWEPSTRGKTMEKKKNTYRTHA
jgi:hypothetical protein